MRLTIIAGLILGTSLAVQSILAAHASAKLGPAASGVGIHAHVIAPWYIAATDRRCGKRIGDVCDAVGSLSS